MVTFKLIVTLKHIFLTNFVVINMFTMKFDTYYLDGYSNNMRGLIMLKFPKQQVNFHFLIYAYILKESTPSFTVACKYQDKITN